MNCSEVLNANKWIVDKDLCMLTWGNVSYMDRDKSVVYIKPSGADLNSISPDDISQVSFDDEKLIGGLKPSVDTKIHLELYRNFEEVKAVVHTHSLHATSFAQASKGIPCLGTTHADYFFGEIPCVPQPTPEMIVEDYERHTGKCIANYFLKHNISSSSVPAALVEGHGVFCWGKTLKNALENAMIVEKIAEMALITLSLNPNSELSSYVLYKHFLRKHGGASYYGQ